jgi:hypothetical protein
VPRIQGYFFVIGAGEATLRTEVLPDFERRAALDPRPIAGISIAPARFGLALRQGAH